MFVFFFSWSKIKGSQFCPFVLFNFRANLSISPAQKIQQMGESSSRKRIQIDVISDTVCPWCFVGKKNLDKAMDLSEARFDFEVRWHPYLLSPTAPKEGMGKMDFYRQKFGARAESIFSRMKQVDASSPVDFHASCLTFLFVQVFQGLGYEYDLSGLWGNTIDSHRLIGLAGKQGFKKQHDLVEELFLNYFTQGKYINDRQVLLEAARKVGVEGAADFLEDPNQGLNELEEELKTSSGQRSGVPHYTLNGKIELSGGQPPEAFLQAFEAAAA